jgi:DNA polymerase III gamma/tau subunit
VLRTGRLEIDELIPWLKKICEIEGIVIKDSRAFKQIAIEADRLPRECLSILETIYHQKEPLTMDLVRDVAQDRQGYADSEPEYRVEFERKR